MNRYLTLVCLLIGFAKNAESETPFLNHAPDVAYVGNVECAACHPKMYETYQQTGMGRSFYLPSPDNVVENFTNPAPIYDVSKDLYYQTYQKDGAFYQREYRQDQNGNVICRAKCAY